MSTKVYTLNLPQVRQLTRYQSLKCNSRVLQITFTPHQQQRKIANDNCNKDKDKISKKVLQECYQAIKHTFQLLIHTVSALYGELAKLCLDETTKVKSKIVCSQTIEVLQRFQSIDHKEYKLAKTYEELLKISHFISDFMYKLQRQTKISLLSPKIPTEQQLFHSLRRKG